MTAIKFLFSCTKSKRKIVTIRWREVLSWKKLWGRNTNYLHCIYKHKVPNWNILLEYILDITIVIFGLLKNLSISNWVIVNHLKHDSWPTDVLPAFKYNKILDLFSSFKEVIYDKTIPEVTACVLGHYPVHITVCETFRWWVFFFPFWLFFLVYQMAVCKILFPALHLHVKC